MAMITCYYDAAMACTYVKEGEAFVPYINRFGIGFGQRGYWGNKHFHTLEAAEAEFQKHVEGCHEPYTKGFAKHVVEDVDLSRAAPSLLKAIRFVNITKAGKRGKIVHTLQLCRIEYRTDDEIQKYIPNAR